MNWGKGLNRKRSKFGEWLDDMGITQNEFAKLANINKDTITKACGDNTWIPGAITTRKIMKVVKEVDPSKRSSDFWEI